jgi:lipoyl(octanoyl) transferase
VAPFGIEATRLEGDNMTGVWLERPPRKLASIGVHVSKWVTTHGYALNVDLDPAPFTEWITACGLDGAAFTTMARELDRPVTVDEVVPHAVAALEDVFGLALDPLPPTTGTASGPSPCTSGSPSRRNDSVPIAGAAAPAPYRRRRWPETRTCCSPSPPRSCSPCSRGREAAVSRPHAPTGR